MAPGADGDEVAPRAATVLDLPAPELPALLADVVPGLLAPIAAAPVRQESHFHVSIRQESGFPDSSGAAALLAELGVHRIGPAELADRLLGVRRPAGWWRAVYAALEHAVETVPGPARRAAGAARPARRRAHGARARQRAAAAGHRRRAGWATSRCPGCTSSTPTPCTRCCSGSAPRSPSPTGCSTTRPCATPSTARWTTPRRGWTRCRWPRPCSALVAELGPGAAASRDWLSALALTDVDGEPARADELMLPDAALRPLLADDAPPAVLGAAWQERASREVLVAVGVLDGFAVVETDAASAPDLGLDDVDRWLDEHDQPDAVVAVRDLDLVRDDAWPAALALLAGEPETRAAVLAPGSYTAWWLARHARLHGHRPASGACRRRRASGRCTTRCPRPVADDAVLAAAGVRAELTVADTATPRTCSPASPTRTAARTPRSSPTPTPRSPPPSSRVGSTPRTSTRRSGSGRWTARSPTSRTPSSSTRPELVAVLPAGEVVVGGDPRALADLLDLPTASEIVDGEVVGDGQARGVGRAARGRRDLPHPRRRGPRRRAWCHDGLGSVLHRPAPGRRRVADLACRDGRRHAEDPVRALLAVLGSATGTE